MKKNFFFSKISVICFFYFIIFNQNINAQEISKPYQISKFIGDTLYRDGRDIYKFFPDFRHFEHAVFYMNDAGLLDAKVRYKLDGIEKDSLIPDYTTIKNMNDYFKNNSFIQGKKYIPLNKEALITMKGGTKIHGQFIAEKKDTIIMTVDKGEKLKLFRNQIENIEINSEGNNYFAESPDPNQSRTFLLPTGHTPKAGTGYIGDYELFLFTAAVGLTDNIMLNGGCLLLPLPLENQIYNFGIKVKVYDKPDKYAVSIGTQLLKMIGYDDSYGIMFASQSFGDKDNKFNLLAGFTYHLGSIYNDKTHLLFGASADLRLGGNTKFLTEFYYSPEWDAVPFVIGIRFFGSKVSGDLGLLYPIGTKINSPIGWPVVSLFYCF